MQIDVSRTGGFAGLREQLGTMDTDSLDPARRTEVEQIVHDADFFALDAMLPDVNLGADLYQYSITVTDHDRHHTVSYTDSGAPATAATAAPEPIATLRRLVAAVEQ